MRMSSIEKNMSTIKDNANYFDDSNASWISNNIEISTMAILKDYNEKPT